MLLLITVFGFIAPLHSSPERDTEVLVSLEMVLAAPEMEFLLKCFSSH